MSRLLIFFLICIFSFPVQANYICYYQTRTLEEDLRNLRFKALEQCYKEAEEREYISGSMLQHLDFIEDEKQECEQTLDASSMLIKDVRCSDLRHRLQERSGFGENDAIVQSFIKKMQELGCE